MKAPTFEMNRLVHIPRQETEWGGWLLWCGLRTGTYHKPGNKTATCLECIAQHNTESP